MTPRDIEGDPQPEISLHLRNNHIRSDKEKGEIECHYCKQMGHTTWNYRI
jgi:hypothetical protein